ncbi:translation initiation factor IF-3 [Candidatus Roizmanbacteria bacterium CG2_30_33_16]|uniref:Translation initiation factor IF-3 n=3 Tax=Candidatus Roizmaniibacteriota TaxID=1752723 RepID=A0A2H0C468_9BACT|nr:translation initiation factor IF-3 [Candidatus Roizmanbacteria bacterium]OIP84661.1 MAG: translation initiation factor IF-3 [Candidatus Roizmanbacteria bacterium CG2_30_33_16]PIP64702.1 MAG: translation initiation factor IF-3 [Candidatus Roizmanbacteria bacterium CG22_combo_CG10-13_8_21_14_all_33_16]
MRNVYRRPPVHRKFYQLNQRIEASELRVIDAQNKQVGVMSRQEALQLGYDKQMDLVLIAATAKPPVAKLIDFSKFLYQEAKKEKAARKGIKKSVTKDIQISLFIGKADLERLINKGKEFLHEGNQLRVNLMLRGREMGKKPMALVLVARVLGQLGDINIVKEPRVEGRVIRAVVAKKKGTIKPVEPIKSVEIS